ncbi:MAG: MFS transporter [Terricaulis sp.]
MERDDGSLRRGDRIPLAARDEDGRWRRRGRLGARHSIYDWRLYPPQKRASAISVQMIGVYGGILLGFLFGGWISEAFGWRHGVSCHGFAGRPVRAVILADRERADQRTKRKYRREGTGADNYRNIEVSVAFAVVRLIPLAAAFHTFAAQGSMSWAPSFFTRTHGMTQTEIGAWLALVRRARGRSWLLLRRRRNGADRQQNWRRALVPPRARALPARDDPRAVRYLPLAHAASRAVDVGRRCLVLEQYVARPRAGDLAGASRV